MSASYVHHHPALAAVTAFAAIVLLTVSCAPLPPLDPDPLPVNSGAETRSLLGVELYAPPLSDDVRADRESRLADARAVFEADPTDLDAIIWYGRRTAYLGQYRNAVAIFVQGRHAAAGTTASATCTAASGSTTTRATATGSAGTWKEIESGTPSLSASVSSKENKEAIRRRSLIGRSHERSRPTPTFALLTPLADFRLKPT